MGRFSQLGSTRSPIVEQLEERALFTTFTVTTDAPGGPGSLRMAINQANGNLGADTIEFNIAPGGPQTITPGSLPSITDTVVIDATTQPGFLGQPIVQLSGAGGGFTDGFTLVGGSDGSVIRGFVINNFTRAGIRVSNGVAGVQVAGNWIGTDVTGNLAVPNLEGGVFLDHAGPNNLIGGSVAADRNVLSGNENQGIVAEFTDNAVIRGNYIGTNAAGNAAVRNGGGIFMHESNFFTIGGPLPGNRNVISGNAGDGIALLTASENTIEGNYIGSTATGAGALNNFGAGVDVRVSSSVNHIGVAGGAPNVIVHNNAGGIVLAWSDNLVRNNRIGVDAANNAAGNFNNGITVTERSNTIGGATAADGNRIGNNSGAGVAVLDGNAILIRNNSIFSNTGLGIDLSAIQTTVDGPTANDPLDADEGPNDLQNFPVITAATTSGATTTITGTLHSTANTTIIIDLFASLLADPTGFGEGERLVGSITVTTDAAGNATFSTTLATAVPGGQFITATATNVARGATSEFSAALMVPLPPPPPDPGNGNGNHNGNGNGNGNHNGATGTNNGKHKGQNK